ncbi:MAG: YIP1 family protein [Candidatus Micrarchaeota archaeon]
MELNEAIERFKKTVFTPTKFFESIQNESNWTELLLYYLYCTAISIPLQLIVFLFYVLIFPTPEVVQAVSTSGMASISILALTFIILNAAVGYFLMLLLIAVFHLFALIFGGRGIYKTFQAFIYALALPLVLSALPLINVFTAFMAFYYAYIGLKVLHKMSWWRALLAGIVFPMLFLLVVASVVSQSVAAAL